MKRGLLGVMALLLALPGPRAADKEPLDIVPKFPPDVTWDIKILNGYVKIHKCHYDKENRVIVWTCTSKFKGSGGIGTLDEKHYPDSAWAHWEVKYLDEDDVQIAKERIWHQPTKLKKGQKCRILCKLREDDLFKKTKKMIIILKEKD